MTELSETQRELRNRWLSGERAKISERVANGEISTSDAQDLLTAVWREYDRRVAQASVDRLAAASAATTGFGRRW